MKIESYSQPAPAAAAHPLRELVDAIDKLEVGKSIRVSGMPLPYLGWSTEYLGRELATLTSAKVEVEYGDKSRTPESYIITRIA